MGRLSPWGLGLSVQPDRTLCGKAVYARGGVAMVPVAGEMISTQSVYDYQYDVLLRIVRRRPRGNGSGFGGSVGASGRKSNQSHYEKNGNKISSHRSEERR